MRTRRRRALFTLAWSAATFCGAAACLLGIRSALDTRSPNLAFLPSPASATPTTAAPTTAAPTPVAKTPTARPSPTRSARPTPAAGIRTYRLEGGRVTLFVGPAVARIVGVRPRSGCTVQTWSSTGWLRVDFGCGRHVSAFFVTWNGAPPAVQSYEF